MQIGIYSSQSTDTAAKTIKKILDDNGIKSFSATKLKGKHTKNKQQTTNDNQQTTNHNKHQTPNTKPQTSNNKQQTTNSN